MNSTLLQYHPLPPVRQALGRPRGPSSPDRDASFCTCGYLGGDASAAQGRAAREEVLATTLPATSVRLHRRATEVLHPRV